MYNRKKSLLLNFLIAIDAMRDVGSNRCKKVRVRDFGPIFFYHMASRCSCYLAKYFFHHIFLHLPDEFWVKFFWFYQIIYRQQEIKFISFYNANALFIMKTRSIRLISIQFLIQFKLCKDHVNVDDSSTLIWTYKMAQYIMEPLNIGLLCLIVHKNNLSDCMKL